MLQGIYVNCLNDFYLSIDSSWWAEQNFMEIQQNYPQYEWRKLSVDAALQLDYAPDLILLASEALIYADSLRIKYPHATIMNADVQLEEF